MLKFILGFLLGGFFGFIISCILMGANLYKTSQKTENTKFDNVVDESACETTNYDGITFSE